MLKQQIHLLAEGSGGTGARPAQLGRQDFGNVLPSILLEVSSPKPRWNFCLHSAEPAESSGPGIPHTQSPGPGVPGEQPDPGGPQAGAREHTDTGNRRNSPRAHPPPFSQSFSVLLDKVWMSHGAASSPQQQSPSSTGLAGSPVLKGWAAAAAAAGAASRKARDEGRRV